MSKIKVLTVSISLVITALLFYTLGTISKTDAYAAEDYNFTCTKISNDATRCENIEVVCYILSGGPGVSCVKK